MEERTVSLAVGLRGVLVAAILGLLVMGLAGVMRLGGGRSSLRDSTPAAPRPAPAQTTAAAPAPPAPAPASAAVASLTTSPAARLGQQALGLVSFDPRLLGYQVSFRSGRKDIRAQIDGDNHRITIYISAGDALHRVAHDIAHELGHAYDARYLTPQARDRYLQLRGRAASTWFPGFRAADYTALALSDYGTGSGDFAEVFAQCHSPSPEFRSTLAPVPAAPCALIPGAK